jgi:enolase
MKGTAIKSITARQVYTHRGHPGVEATVVTENGGTGVAVCTAGVSVGQHEVPFTYDGGTKWRGRGVTGAVSNVNEIIAPALKGVDAATQVMIDDVMLNIGGSNAKRRLGGNATAAVSAAALKAGADALGVPLYQHIGGVNAVTLPVPEVGALGGSDRYGGGGSESGGKPSHEFVCYGFDTFSEASYAGWDLYTEWVQVLRKELGLPRGGSGRATTVPAGKVEHDREIWDLMVETINRMGYEG